MTPTDTELIGQVLWEDDRDAYGELVKRHQSAVRRFLRHLTGGDAALADDLAQDAFVQAYRSLPKFRGHAAFSTWLLGIAHNCWRNAERQRRRERDFASEGGTEETVGPAADVSDLKHDLAHALRQLSPAEQSVIHLAYHQGLSHEEIADVLACPLGTAKTHLARGKDKLRQLLASWNPRT